MLVSAELRWFWQRTCPPEVLNWFNGGMPPGGGQQERRDRYFKNKGNHEIGMKLRGETLSKAPVEIKGLVEVSTGHSVGYPVELWCKWPGPEVVGAEFVSLDKLRWLKMFDVSSGEVREIQLGADEQPLDSVSLPELGCNVELTRVRVVGMDSEWWTLGFEAFGGVTSAPEALELVFSANSPPTAGGSLLSYPKWIDLNLG